MPQVVKSKSLPRLEDYPGLDCRWTQMIGRQILPTRGVLPCVFGDSNTSQWGCPFQDVRRMLRAESTNTTKKALDQAVTFRPPVAAGAAAPLVPEVTNPPICCRSF